MFKKIFLFYNTLRHLKFIQWYWRVYLNIKSFIPCALVPKESIDCKQLKIVSCIDKYETFTANTFTFLKVSRPVTYPVKWNDSGISLLWLYNLHYFDYLNQRQLDASVAVGLIDDWIAQNKVSVGAGWQPYPISLRVVNWIKYLSRIDSYDGDIERVYQSLYLQTRYLYKNLEYHLLANHLFKNGVALVFAGVYFEGKESSLWLKKGLHIINMQVKEQVLPDGGHFERSPTYHVLILEDILDCLNISQTNDCIPKPVISRLKKVATLMLSFLYDILHQDGELPFFNDGALKIAPVPEKIFEYAGKLGFEVGQYTFPVFKKITASRSIIEKHSFGLYVLINKTSRMIVDAGVIGPDYQPGHAHCDTLSYELSINGDRCIVNSGTFQYLGANRNYFRSTKAHNTVRINNEEQHETWSTFRVARRGYPFDVRVNKSLNCISFMASHSGYKRFKGKPVHTRRIDCVENCWLIEDTISGEGEFFAESFVHLHPDVEILEYSASTIKCKIHENNFVLITNSETGFIMEEGLFSSEFGVKESNKVLVLRKKAIAPFSIEYSIT